MEKEQDLFDKLPKEYMGLILAAGGVLLLVGAIRRRKWVLDMTGERSRKPFGFLTLMQDWFGENGVRVGMMILSVVIIVCGLVMFFLS